MPTNSYSRRDFIVTSAAAASSAITSSAIADISSRGVRSPNSRLRIGFIGVGGRAQMHLESAIRLQKDKHLVEIAAVCDVFSRYRDEAVEKVHSAVGKKPVSTGDYRDIINDASIDAVVISTPDHWHATQTIASLKAGKAVYCEKPMTHTVEEALEVHNTWKKSGRVMQVGVQSTSLPVWDAINEQICAGDLGKVLQYQTEFFRNSDMGQWRYYRLSEDMTPKTIDWRMFLGTEEGLAPSQPFDRARFAQWRCYWDFGSGMFTDLFVHRTTSMLKATGLRFPGRVVGAGGIFLEYDGRTVPDVATVVADFDEGVQGLVTATMCSGETPIRQIIRGHHGSVVLGTGEEFSGYDFVAERPQVTHDSSIKSKRVEVGKVDSTSLTHFTNFVEAAIAEKPEAVNCSPELGASAMCIVKLGARSYREGKAYHFDRDKLQFGQADSSWATKWEEMSKQGTKPNHVDGWHAGDKGSVLYPKDYQTLAGPWVNGKPPVGASAG